MLHRKCRQPHQQQQQCTAAALPGRCPASSSRAQPLQHAPISASSARALRLRCNVAITDAKSKAAYANFSNANFPVDAEGRTYHLGTKRGEVANRLLSVGSTSRAQLLAKLLEPPAPGRQLFTRMSSRGFLTITGRFEGVPVSIVSTHMGMPNMDFVVRENRAVVDGQMAIVRLGTCGAIQPPAKLGDFLVASHGSIAIRRDPDAWGRQGTNGRASGPYYATSQPVGADAGLAHVLVEEAEALVGPGHVVQGLNASTDSFYSSQGRLGGEFDDHNESLISSLCQAHPNLVSLEMETFHLLDLARCAKGGSIRAVGMCIGLAERYSNRFLDHDSLQAAELLGGQASLRALVRTQLTADASLKPVPDVKYVWA